MRIGSLVKWWAWGGGGRCLYSRKPLTKWRQLLSVWGAIYATMAFLMLQKSFLLSVGFAVERLLLIYHCNSCGLRSNLASFQKLLLLKPSSLCGSFKQFRWLLKDAIALAFQPLGLLLNFS